MPEFSHIFAFLYAVLWRNMLLLILGGLPTMVEKAYEWKTGRNLPHGSYLKWAFVITALIAVFMAWHEEYEGRLKLEKKEAQFNDREAQIKQKDGEVAQLRGELSSKDNLIHDLKREKDLLIVRNEAAVKDAGVTVEGLRNQLADKERRIRELEAKQSDRAKRAMIRERLGEFRQATKPFEKQLMQDSHKVPNELRLTMRGWEKTVHDFLITELDSSFADRFDRGTPSGMIPLMTGGMTPDWISWWSWLEGKNLVLGRFMEEFGQVR